MSTKIALCKKYPKPFVIEASNSWFSHLPLHTQKTGKPSSETQARYFWARKNHKSKDLGVATVYEEASPRMNARFDRLLRYTIQGKDRKLYWIENDDSKEEGV